MSRPSPTAGMRHVALNVADVDACKRFYVDLMGMRVEWEPDPDNVYLTSGNDNLAIHKGPDGFDPSGHQRLDHIGFIVDTPRDVDDWYAFLCENGVEIKAAPRTHRDGARSFYCADPGGNIVQIIYHPPISRGVG